MALKKCSYRKQIFHSIVFSAYIFDFLNFFFCGLFRAMGYLFGYKSVIFDNSPLFHVWGTWLDLNLCWKCKFGSVNLGFLPFYGLLVAFTAFLLMFAIKTVISSNWPKRISVTWGRSSNLIGPAEGFLRSLNNFFQKIHSFTLRRVFGL